MHDLRVHLGRCRRRTRVSAFLTAKVKSGMSEDAAAAYVNGFPRYAAENPDDEFSAGDNRPLPYELKDRESLDRADTVAKSRPRWRPRSWVGSLNAAIRDRVRQGSSSALTSREGLMAATA